MAEATRKKPTTVKKTAKPKAVVTPKKTTRKRKQANSLIAYFNVAKQRLVGLRTTYLGLPPLKKYGFPLLLILILSAIYFKNLFIVALVNGQPITRFEVIGQLEKNNGKKILSDIVVKTLILQEAKKNNIVISQQDVDDQMKKLEESVTSQGEKFEDALSAQGITKVELIENIRLNKIIEKLLQNDLNVTDKEIDGYLEANKDSLPKEASDEAKRVQAKEALTGEKKSTKAQELIARLKNDAKINYFINY